MQLLRELIHKAEKEEILEERKYTILDISWSIRFLERLIWEDFTYPIYLFS